MPKILILFRIFCYVLKEFFILNVWLCARPKHNKKKYDLFFLFILVRTTTKSIQFIKKPVFLFSFFLCCCFAFISRQQQQKNLHFIYDISMLRLGLSCVMSIVAIARLNPLAISMFFPFLCFTVKSYCWSCIIQRQRRFETGVFIASNHCSAK
jgi:hypothetical protein